MHDKDFTENGKEKIAVLDNILSILLVVIRYSDQIYTENGYLVLQTTKNIFKVSGSF